jgi:membrane fusion protein (multidrug efflux system)
MLKRSSVAAIGLLFTICVAIPSLSYAGKKDQGGMPPAVVAIAPVKVETWQNNVTAIGTLSANQGIVIKPEIEGRVTGVYFRSGDYVKVGTPLLQINPDILKAQYAQAEAKAKLAKANYQRTITLYNKRVFAKADLDTALANYQSDQATADQAKASLEQSLIRAPFSGRLGMRQVNLGDYVASGQAIVNLEATDPMRVDFSVPEIYINQVALGQTVDISSRSYLKTTFKGRVYALDSMIDPNTRTLAVRAVIANKEQKLIPGAFVDVKLLTGKPQKTIVIPQTALSYEGNNINVYKVVNGKAVKTQVTTGMRKDDNIAILTGLKAGDSVITAGQMKVTDGQAVMASP